MIVYFNGQFMPKNEVKISPDDRGFLFADGAYEVIRAYHGKLFKIDRHIERMTRSLRELRIKEPEQEIYEDVAEELIQNNDLLNGEALIYIQVTRGAAPRRHAFPGSDTPPTVYAYASPFQPFPERLTHGVKITLVPDIRWTRCDIKSVSLLPNVLANQAAQQAGAKAFHAAIYGEDVSYLSRPYPEQSRQMIVDRIANTLDGSGSAAVNDWLNERGLTVFAG